MHFAARHVHNADVRVLVVEDEERLANAIARGLTADGFDVDVAGDGPTGLWRAREHAYAHDRARPVAAGHERVRGVPHVARGGQLDADPRAHRQDRRVRRGGGARHGSRRLLVEAVLVRRPDGPGSSPVEATAARGPAGARVRIAATRPRPAAVRARRIGDQALATRVLTPRVAAAPRRDGRREAGVDVRRAGDPTTSATATSSRSTSGRCARRSTCRTPPSRSRPCAAPATGWWRMRDRLRRVTGSVRVRVALVAMLLVGGVLVVSGIVLTRTVKHRLEEENRERADQTIAYAADRLEAGVAVDSVFATTRRAGRRVHGAAPGRRHGDRQPATGSVHDPDRCHRVGRGRLGRGDVRLRRWPCPRRAPRSSPASSTSRRASRCWSGSRRSTTSGKVWPPWCNALWWGSPVLVLLVGLIAWLLVGRALRPVEQLARHRRDDFALDARTARRRPTIPRRGRPAGDDDEHHARAAAAFPGPRTALRVGRLARAAQPAGEHPGPARSRRTSRHRRSGPACSPTRSGSSASSAT